MVTRALGKNWKLGRLGTRWMPSGGKGALAEPAFSKSMGFSNRALFCFFDMT
jgi:hypothetical protein